MIFVDFHCLVIISVERLEGWGEVCEYTSSDVFVYYKPIFAYSLSKGYIIEIAGGGMRERGNISRATTTHIPSHAKTMVSEGRMKILSGVPVAPLVMAVQKLNKQLKCYLPND